MASASKRNFGGGPVSREVIDRHNQHEPITFPEYRERERQAMRLKLRRRGWTEQEISEWEEGL